MTEYITRDAAMVLLKSCTWGKSQRQSIDELLRIEPAKALPYQALDDGTLVITIPKGMAVGRVLLQEDGTQFGGLYYGE